jgi:hypothetical protein
MGNSGLWGIVNFALGDSFILVSFFLIEASIRSSPENFLGLIIGIILAVVGIVLAALGLISIIRAQNQKAHVKNDSGY